MKGLHEPYLMQIAQRNNKIDGISDMLHRKSVSISKVSPFRKIDEPLKK